MDKTHNPETFDVGGDYPGADYDVDWQSKVFPRDYINPTAEGCYNLVVIGAGPAGLITAIGAAGLGAKVALIERKSMGGDCLNVGCVPSKAILAASKRYAGADDGFDQAMIWLRKVRASISGHDSVERYNDQGVEVFLGNARLNADGDVEVGDQILRTKRVAICTGSRAVMPPIPGLDQVNALTNETVFALTEKPKDMIIIGAGPIGCELSQALSRLGVKVTLLERADRIMSIDEPEASEVLQKSMDELGVEIRLETEIQSVEQNAGRITVKLASQESLSADQLLVAAGRGANLEDMGLDEAGVAYNRHGIEVDAKLRTSNKKIYAAGDVSSRVKLTHHADAQARIVIANALFLPTGKADNLVIPHCTYTDPEVAHVGITKADAKQQNIDYQTWTVNWSDLDRAKAEGDTAGFVEVLTAKGKDKILGATVVGRHAGDLLSPLSIMMANNLGLSAANKTILCYPTRSEYLRRLADQYNRTRLTPMVASLMKRWLAWRR